VIYVPCKDAANRNDLTPSAVSVLGRFRYLLTGDPSAAGQAKGQLATLAALTSQDWLGGSLEDIEQEAPWPTSLQPVLAAFLGRHVAPAVSGLASLSLNTEPASAGQVNDLWPYLAAGCMRMKVEFSPAEMSGLQPVAWVWPTGFAPAGNIAGTLSVSGKNVPYILWTRRNKDVWPNAIRLTLGMRQLVGGQETIVDSQIVINLPK